VMTGRPRPWSSAAERTGTQTLAAGSQIWLICYFLPATDGIIWPL
jgi:hypothetical protein